MILAWMFRFKEEKLKAGSVLATAIIMSFTFRFFIEFVKDNQSTISANLPINMGQLLSIGFVSFGVILLLKIRSKKD